MIFTQHEDAHLGLVELREQHPLFWWRVGLSRGRRGAHRAELGGRQDLSEVCQDPAHGLTGVSGVRKLDNRGRAGLSLREKQERRYSCSS